jgi:hypothetical protein
VRQHEKGSSAPNGSWLEFGEMSKEQVGSVDLTAGVWKQTVAVGERKAALRCRLLPEALAGGVLSVEAKSPKSDLAEQGKCRSAVLDAMFKPTTVSR